MSGRTLQKDRVQRSSWAWRNTIALVVVFLAFLAAKSLDFGNHSTAQAPLTPGPAETAPPLPTAVDPSPSASPSASQVLSPTPLATAPADLVPGSAVLNDLAVAVRDGDVAFLAARARLLDLPCGASAGSGGMPVCASGQRTGTVVQVLPVVACTGTYVRSGDLETYFRGQGWTFNFAINLKPTPADSRFPVGAKGLVLASRAGGAVLTAHADGGIASLYIPCDQTVGELVNALQSGHGYDALARLQDTFEDELASTWVDGVYGISVVDLQTGLSVGAGDIEAMPSGCVMNLLVIIEVLRQVQAGRYPLAEVDATIRQTIRFSDASAAFLLYQQAGSGDSGAGVDAVARLIRDLGLARSSIDHPPAYSDGEAALFLPNLVSAADMNLALHQLYDGLILDGELTAYLLQAMTDVKPGLNYLTAALPGEALVSHKNGFFWNESGWVDNDTAIVRFGFENEYAYAITFLSDEVDVLYSEIPLAQSLVYAAWGHFSATYP